MDESIEVVCECGQVYHVYIVTWLSGRSLWERALVDGNWQRRNECAACGRSLLARAERVLAVRDLCGS